MRFEKTEQVPHSQPPLERTPAWNVVVTAHERGFRDAKHALRRYGPVETTHFFNVLVLRVDDIGEFLRELAARFAVQPHLRDCISRVMPAMRVFTFVSVEDFESKTKRIIEEWCGRVENKSFHVRVHRRGHRGTISSLGEEQSLDRFILDCVGSSGALARIDFTDPDFIIDLEILDNEVGLSIWSREELRDYPFLHLK